MNIYNQHYVISTYKITVQSQYLIHAACSCHSMLYLQRCNLILEQRNKMYLAITIHLGLQFTCYVNK
jgi:hypothetical protein